MPNARQIALKYMSPRYCRLEHHERYVEGTQYDGRAPFMSTSDDAPPLLERAPCIVYGITQTAIKDLIAFMMGEDRFPFFSAAPSEDDEDLDDLWGLNEDDSHLFERWLNGPLCRSARLKAVLPEAVDKAMQSGSVCIVGAIRKGLPHLEVLPAKWCSPTFDQATGEMVSLEVKYPYLTEEHNPVSGRYEEVCYVYRRVITPFVDVVFYPGRGREDGKDPDWVMDPSQTALHGLGFCPVHWYAFRKGEPTPSNYDGRPLHHCLKDEIDALNFSLSQRHRAALYSGDPQLYETGVDQNANPAPMGRPANVQIEPQAGGPDGKAIGVFTANPRRQRRGGARKKGPGVVWRYEDAGSKVGMLTLPGDSLDAMADHAEDLRRKLAEDMSVMLLDPTDASKLGALSGRALAFLFSRQIAFCDALRLDLADNLFLPVTDMLLRLICAIGKRYPTGMRIPGLTKLQPVLQKFERELASKPLVSMTEAVQDHDGDEMPGTEWFGPRIELQWGPYFAMSAEEENFLVTMVINAYTKGLIPITLALEKLREVFKFTSVEEITKMLEDERVKKQAEMVAQADAMGQVAAKNDTKASNDNGGRDMAAAAE